MNSHYVIAGEHWYLNDHNMLRNGRGKVFILNDLSFYIIKTVLEEIESGMNNPLFNISVENLFDIVLNERIESIKKRLEKEYDIDDIIRIYKDCSRLFTIIRNNDVMNHEFYSISGRIPAPVHIDFALTYRCNNDCYHCYHGGSKPENELRRDEIALALDKLGNAGVFEINFTGGEPLLRLDDLEYLINKYGDYFNVQVATNGRLLSSEICERFKNKVKNIQISIQHVLSREHDLMCGSDGAWRDTVQGITNAVTSGIGLTTLTTLQKENKDSIDELVIFLAETGVKTIGINSLFYSEQSRIPDSCRISKLELSDITKRIKKVAEDHGSAINFMFPICYRILDPVNVVGNFRRCSATVNTLAIEPDGKVIPCSCWFHENCGNIVSDDWSKIWTSDTVLRIRNRKPPSECVRCEWIDKCNGACPLEECSRCS